VTGVIRSRRFEHFGQFAPAALDLGQVGHVGHRAAGGEVGQDGHLVGRGHDVRHFGHEMHAAEHDVFGVGLEARRDSLSESPVRSAYW
jgi:hypothetical protein